MSLSPSAKLLLSKHPESCKEIVDEYYQLEYLKLVQPIHFQPQKEDTTWTDFVRKHSEPKRDWEIVSISEPAPCKMYVHPKNEDGTFGVWSNAHHTLEEALKIGWGIHSVKRLSDEVTFTVGDEVEYVGGEYGKWIIQNFFLKDEGVLARSEGNNYCEFVHDKKFVKSKPAILTTEDGKQIFEGDDFWSINSDFEIRRWTATKYNTSRWADGVHLFSTQELCKEYALLNKPCFSVNDLTESLSVIFNKDEAIRLAKQKSTHA